MLSREGQRPNFCYKPPPRLICWDVGLKQRFLPTTKNKNRQQNNTHISVSLRLFFFVKRKSSRRPALPTHPRVACPQLPLVFAFFWKRIPRCRHPLVFCSCIVFRAYKLPVFPRYFYLLFAGGQEFLCSASAILTGSDHKPPCLRATRSFATQKQRMRGHKEILKFLKESLTPGFILINKKL